MACGTAGILTGSRKAKVACWETERYAHMYSVEVLDLAWFAKIVKCIVHQLL